MSLKDGLANDGRMPSALPDEKLEEVYGGMLQRLALRRAKQDYYDAGIQLQSIDGGPYEFFYRGRQICQQCADELADFFFAHDRRATEKEIRLY